MSNPSRKLLSWRKDGLLILFVVLLAFLSGATGGHIASSQDGPMKEFISVVSAVGTFGAAIATFLTVREMKAGRVQSSRARLAASTNTATTMFDWTISPRLMEPKLADLKLTVRNASQGTAWNAHVEWQADRKIDEGDLARVECLLGRGATVSVDSTGFRLLIDHNHSSISVPVDGKSTAYLGDIGPGQQLEAVVPEATLNYAMVLILAVIDRIRTGDIVSLGDLPLFSITFHHDSPYEAGVVDRQIGRFFLGDYQLINGNGQRHRDFRKAWRAVEGQMRYEASSPRIEALPALVH